MRHSDSTSCLFRRVLTEEEASVDRRRLWPEGRGSFAKIRLQRERDEQGTGATCGRAAGSPAHRSAPWSPGGSARAPPASPLGSAEKEGGVPEAGPVPARGEAANVWDSVAVSADRTAG